jgi:hypothetical protein
MTEFLQPFSPSPLQQKKKKKKNPETLNAALPVSPQPSNITLPYLAHVQQRPTQALQY